MQKIINNNHKILKQKFKKEFLNWIINIKKQEKIIIWLSWWSSLTIFYNDFENIFNEIKPESREKIYFALLDERVVDFSDDDSNYKQLKNQFLDNLINKWYIKQNQIILPDFKKENYETDYFNKVKTIDIWLLWVWTDWHTCSLFPNHELLKDNTYWYLNIKDSPKPPKERITISVPMLIETKLAFAFFMWENKKEAFYNFLNTSLNNSDCPIKLIKNCKNYKIISDINII